MGQLLTRRREMILPSGADGYVDDGIILWLDGIWNTRTGHDANAAKWEDLSGNGHDYAYRADSVVAQKYCIPNGQMAADIASPTISTTYTIEIVTDIQNTGSAQFVHARGNNYGTIFFNNAANTLWVKTSNTSGQAYGMDAQSGITTYTCQDSTHYFINSVATSRKTGRTSWTATNLTKYLFYYNSSYPYPFTSPFYALRIYNRTLTEAEIAQNYAQDVLRFGGGN